MTVFSVSYFFSHGRLIPLIKRLEYNLRDFNNIHLTSLIRTNCPGSLETVSFSLNLADINENIPLHFLFGDTRMCLIRSKNSFFPERTIQVQRQMMKRILRYIWMFLSILFTDLKYLNTNISARRSVECKVISDIFS